MLGDWSALFPSPPPAGVLGGAHVRRCGGGPHIRFPASTQIRRLPRTHEGPGQRSGGRLWRQRGQRHHHSGDGAKIAPWTQSHLAAYICVFVYISCKKKLLNLARLLFFFFVLFVMPMRIVVTGYFVSLKNTHTHTLLCLAPLYIFYPNWRKKSRRGLWWNHLLNLLCHISTYDEPFLCLSILILHTYGWSIMCLLINICHFVFFNK